MVCAAWSMSPSAGQDLYSRLILGMSKELSVVACWTLSFLPGLATPPGISPMRWRPLPHAAGCRRQGVFMVPIWDVSPRASCRRERRGTLCSVLLVPVGAAALC